LSSKQQTTTAEDNKMTILDGEVHKLDGYRDFKDELDVSRHEIEAVLSDDARETMIEATQQNADVFDIDDTDDMTIGDVPDDIFRDFQDIDTDRILMKDILTNRSGRYVFLNDGMKFYTIVNIDN
jgi:hypothetical protein